MKYVNRALACHANKALPNQAGNSLDTVTLQTNCDDDTGLAESLLHCPDTNNGRQS